MNYGTGWLSDFSTLNWLRPIASQFIIHFAMKVYHGSNIQITEIDLLCIYFIQTPITIRR
jgi:hypothetical protein